MTRKMTTRINDDSSDFRTGVELLSGSSSSRNIGAAT
jgi:hypothetical protein